MAQIDIKNCTFQIKDGSGTPNALELSIGNGTLTWTRRRNFEYILNRGRLDTVREGNKVPVDVRFDLKWDYYKAVSGAGTPTPIDALKKEGEASSWVTSDADTCKPYAVDIVITNTPGCGSNSTETITIADFRYEQIDGDPRAGTLNVSGRANVATYTAVRS
jgi:hypothetical protein